jgi:hypothetical protein
VGTFGTGRISQQVDISPALAAGRAARKYDVFTPRSLGAFASLRGLGVDVLFCTMPLMTALATRPA